MRNKLLTIGLVLLIACSTSVNAQSKKEQASFDAFLKSNIRQKLIPFTDGKNKFGFMDSISRSIVIPANFDQVNAFNNGMAVVRQNNKYGFVRDDGKIIAPKYDMVTLFKEGLSAVFNGKVTKNDKNEITGLDGLWGYIDRNGNELISLKYMVALPFEEGLGHVNMNNNVGFINKSEKIAIPLIYQDGYSFKNGKAKVKLNNQWIYINVFGEKITDTTSAVKHPTYFQHLGEVIKLGEIEDINMYLSKGYDINEKYNNRPPIEYLFERRKSDNNSIFTLLINSGCDINSQMSNGDPLIYSVVTYGYSDIDKYEAIKLLLDKKANVNATNSSKNTSLHALCWALESEQNFLIAKLLIENGANVNLQNVYKETPLKLAKDNKRKDLVELIKNAPKK